MKKTAIILFLALTYAASSSGFAVKADYCCNILQSVKLVLAEGAQDKEGCCKVKYQSFKVSDTHAAAYIINAPALTFTFIDVPYNSFELNTLASQAGSRFINIHAPPLINSTPAYISNCVFRI